MQPSIPPGVPDIGGPAESQSEVIVGACPAQNTAWTNVERALHNLRSAHPLTIAGARNVTDYAPQPRARRTAPTLAQVCIEMHGLPVGAGQRYCRRKPLRARLARSAQFFLIPQAAQSTALESSCTFGCFTGSRRPPRILSSPKENVYEDCGSREYVCGPAAI